MAAKGPVTSRSSPPRASSRFTPLENERHGLSIRKPARYTSSLRVSWVNTLRHSPLMNSYASQSPARASSAFPFGSRSQAVRQVWVRSRERALSGRRALPVPYLSATVRVPDSLPVVSAKLVTYLRREAQISGASAHAANRVPAGDPKIPLELQAAPAADDVLGDLKLVAGFEVGAERGSDRGRCVAC